MTLPERLHTILSRLRDGFGIEVPDPAELDNAGEIQVRGIPFTVRSSMPLDEFAKAEKFTVYLHSQGQDEAVYYFHFEGRREISSINVRLVVSDNATQQSVTMSSLPREIFVQRVERALGRGAPRERRPGGGGRDRRFGGGGDQRRSRPRPPRREESMESMPENY